MGQTSSLELQIPKNKTYNGVKEDAQRHDFAGYEARSMKWNWPDTSVGSSSLGFQHHLLLLILGVQHKSREPGIKWDWFVVIASAWTSRQLVQKKKKRKSRQKYTTTTKRSTSHRSSSHNIALNNNKTKDAEQSTSANPWIWKLAVLSQISCLSASQQMSRKPGCFRSRQPPWKHMEAGECTKQLSVNGF